MLSQVGKRYLQAEEGSSNRKNYGEEENKKHILIGGLSGGGAGTSFSAHVSSELK